MRRGKYFYFYLMLFLFSFVFSKKDYKKSLEGIPYIYKGLKLRIEVPKDTFLQGEPVAIRCWFINTGSDTIFLEKMTGELMGGATRIAIYIKTPKREIVKYRTYGSAFVVSRWYTIKDYGKRHAVSIPSHDSVYDWAFPILVDPAPDYEMTKPSFVPWDKGMYTIQIVYRGYGYEKFGWLWSGRIKSNKIKIYLNSLKGEDRKAFNILKKDSYYREWRARGAYPDNGSPWIDHRYLKGIRKVYTQYPGSCYAPFCLVMDISQFLFGVPEDRDYKKVCDLCKRFEKMYPGHYLLPDVYIYHAIALLYQKKNKEAKKYLKKFKKLGYKKGIFHDNFIRDEERNWKTVETLKRYLETL